MDMKNRIIAFLAGVLLGPAVVFASLESGTYISDLVSTNPLGSDLASTLDDHIRLLKSTIKTTFPNINGAVTVTDEQLNAVATNVAANPTGTIGLTAVNGSASTYLRSDGAPALSQSITPTWTGTHIFTKSGGSGSEAIQLSSAVPVSSWNETDGAANNRYWFQGANAEQFIFGVENDAHAAGGTIMTVDRTGNTIDVVSFPSDVAAGNFSVGATTGTTVNNARMRVRTASSGVAAAQFTNGGGVGPVAVIHNPDTASDNGFISFHTEAGATQRGSITYNRAGGLVAYNTTSDMRLKKNFRPSPSARGVIDCIQIESYDWKESGNHVDHGVVAQRLEKCAPYAVSKGKVWQVDKSTLIPAMIKYMQEQDARISELERRLH